jgi:hypothetical protein
MTLYEILQKKYSKEELEELYNEMQQHRKSINELKFDESDIENLYGIDKIAYLNDKLIKLIKR